MIFKIVFRWTDGTLSAEWHELAETQAEMTRLTDLLGNIKPGETITVERIS